MFFGESDTNVFLNANFTLSTMVGNLNESKIKGLNEVLSSEFPEINRPNSNIIIYKNGLSGIVITPEQLTYIYQGNYEDIDLEYVANQLLKVSDILRVSSRVNIEIKAELTDETNVNTMEKSKTFVEEAANILESRGVGFRFMIDQPSFGGDIFIEPFVQDNQKVFYNIVLRAKNVVEQSNVKSTLIELLDFGVIQGRDAAKTLLY